MKQKINLLITFVSILLLIMSVTVILHGNEMKIERYNSKNYEVDNNYKFSMSVDKQEVEVKPGETVKFAIIVSDVNAGNIGINNIIGELNYNKDLFEEVKINPVNAQNEGNLSDWLVSINSLENLDYGKFVLYTMKTGIKENQKIAEISLTLKEKMSAQNTILSLTKINSSEGNILINTEDVDISLKIAGQKPESNKLTKEEIVEEKEEEKTVEQKTAEQIEINPIINLVKTADTVIIKLAVIILIIVIANILAWKLKGKIKMIFIIVLMFLAVGVLTTVFATDFWKEIDTQSVLQELSQEEKILNSSKYLVTENAISRVLPNTTVQELKENLNMSAEKISVISKESGIEEIQENSEIVKSSMEVNVEGKENSYIINVLGDLNSDGQANSIELTRIIRQIVDKENWEIQEDKKESADLNFDKKIDDEDKIKLINYIINGIMEVTNIEIVKKPVLTIVEGEKENDWYYDNAVVKINEEEQNPLKTVYKIEGVGENLKLLTEINNDETIIIDKKGIYKISAYTYGKLGNCSEITTLIIQKNDKYTIEYNANGGIHPPQSQIKIDGQDINLTENLPINEGYTFKGWGIYETDTEATYQPGDVFKENQNTVLYAIWKPNVYRLTLKAGENVASVTDGKINGKEITSYNEYGKQLNIAATLKQEEGYTIAWVNWSSDNPEVLVDQALQEAIIGTPLGDVTLMANATKTINKYDYRIEYYYDNILDSTKTIERNVDYNSLINSYSSKSKNGYEFDKIEVGVNKSNVLPLIVGSNEEHNVIKVYYKLINYNIEYDLQGENVENSNVTTYNLKTETFTLSNPERDGYSFEGWTEIINGVESGNVKEIVTIEKGTVGNKKYKANWLADTDTYYKVEHYKENLEGEYELEETEELTGETDSTVTATIKAYTGFSENVEHINRNAANVITGDGELVLRRYYARNTYKVYLYKNENVESISINGTEELGSTLIVDIKYGINVTLSATMSQPREGYHMDFVGWIKELTSAKGDIYTRNTSFYMPNGDVILRATASENPNIYSYKVEYYYDSDIQSNKTVNATANFNSIVTEVKNKVVEGYEFDKALIGKDEIECTDYNDIELTIGMNVQENIIKMYYKLIQYQLDYELEGGHFEDLEYEVSYNAKSDFELDIPEKEGYTFDGWKLIELDGSEVLNSEINLNTIIQVGTIGNRKYKANWRANTDTQYLVQHYQEDINGEYVIFETEELEGTTGVTATATIKQYNGFSENTTTENREISGEIEANGGLILKVYYARNEYALTLVVGDYVTSVKGTGTEGIGNGVETIATETEGIVTANYKYGQRVSLSAVLAEAQTGYTIVWQGWSLKNVIAFEEPLNKETTITMPAGNVILQATAESERRTFGYTIMYYYNNVLDEEATVEESGLFEKQVISFSNKDRLGYIFDRVETLPMYITEIEENNVIKVYYDIVNYDIEYNLNEGSLPEGENNPITYNVETDNFTLINPTREGYAFLGWTEEVTDGETIITETPQTEVTIEKGNVGDRVYTAVWERIEYSVIIHHYEEGTTTKVAEDEIIEGYYHEPYDITSLIEPEEINEDREWLNPDKYNFINVEKTLEGINNTNETTGEITGEFCAKGGVVTYYYSINRYEITGEVVGEYGTISDFDEIIVHGENSTKNIILTPQTSTIETIQYRVANISINGIALVDFDEDVETKVVELPKFENVTEDKNIVVTFEEVPTAIMITSAPTGYETLANTEYKTLEEAIDIININGIQDQVTLKLVANVRNESNIILNELNILLDLNGHQIQSKLPTPTITIQDAVLTLVDESEEQTGRVISRTGTAVYVSKEGTLNLGEDKKPISLTSPEIVGETCGVYVEDLALQKGTFNFYDGKISGEVAINKVDDTPLLNSATVTIEEDIQIATLAVVTNVEARIGKKTYVLLEDAIAAANNEVGTSEEQVEIVVLKDLVKNEKIEIDTTKNIKINLGGHKITNTIAQYVFENSGKLEISDYPYIMIEEIVENGTYYFKSDIDGKIYSTNKYVANETANSYMEIDLESCEGIYQLTVNSSISSQEGFDFGYATITSTTEAPVHDVEEGRFMYISGTVEATDYMTELVGGQKYYLHLGYYKDGTTNSGNDTLVINNVILRQNGEVIVENGNNGKITGINESAILNNVGAILKISGGVISGAKVGTSSTYKYAIINNGDFELAGGMINAVANYSGCVNNVGTMKMSGGIIINAIDNSRGINNQITGNFTMTGGEIVVNKDGIYNIGALYFNGGTIDTKSGYGIYNTYFKYENSIPVSSSFVIDNLKLKGYQGVYTYGSGVIEVNNVTTNLTSYAFYNYVRGTININSGYIKAGTAIWQENTGIINIKNTQITGSTVITNYRSGIVNLENVTINAVGQAIRNAIKDNTSAGNVTIKDCTITNTGKYTTEKIENAGCGIITINGLILNTNYLGIKNTGTGEIIVNKIRIEGATYGIINTSTGRITLGVNDGVIDNDGIYINSSINGILIVKGELYYYDGTIRGMSGQAINGDITEKATGKEINVVNDTIGWINGAFTSDTYIGELTTNSTVSPYKIFDGSTSNTWSSKGGSTQEWIQWRLGMKEKLKINSFEICGYYAYTPKAVELYASNDGESWEKIAHKTGMSSTNNTTYFEVVVDEPEYYQFYKWNFPEGSSSSSSSKVNIVCEINLNAEFMGVQPKGTEILTLVETSENVAKIYDIENENADENGYVHYSTLQAAIDACEDNQESAQNIIMEQTILISSNINIASTKNVNIDLDGNRIIANSSIASFENNGKLKISDSSVYKEGHVAVSGKTFLKNNATASFEIDINKFYILKGNSLSISATEKIFLNEGNLKISNLETTVNSDYTYFIENIGSGNVVIDNVNYLDDSYYSRFINDIGNGNIEINNGTIKYTTDRINYFIKKDGMGNIDINGGDISSSYYGIQKSGEGKITVAGGSLGATQTAITGENACAIDISGGIVSGVISNSGIMNVTGGEIKGKIGITNTSTGEITVTAGKITGNGSDNTYYSAIRNYGKVTVLGGTLISTYRAGLYNYSTGSMTIGIQGDGVVNTENPYIKGIYGVYNAGGILNFYDGKIEGSTNNSIYGNVSAQETDYDIIKTTVESRETAILGQVPLAKVVSTGEEFITIQEAVNAAQDNKKETIEILRPATMLESTPTIEIPMEKDIVLDIKDFYLSVGNEITFNNLGKLEINSSTAKKIGKITNTKGQLLTNAENAIFTLTAGNIVTTNIGTSSEYKNVIDNKGSVIVNGGTIYPTGNYKNVIYCSGIGNFVQNGGTINTNSTYNYAVFNAGGGTVIINSGTINASGDYSIGINTSEETVGDISVIDGIISGTFKAIVNKGTGTINISGGKINNYVENTVSEINVTGGTISSINNSGIANITGGKISTSNKNGIQNSGTLLVKDVEVIGYPAIRNSKTGNVTIENSILTASRKYDYGYYTSYSHGLYNLGTATIYSGTIISEYNDAIQNFSEATLNLEVAEGSEVSITEPNISGKGGGIYNIGTLNFNNGIVTGTTSAVLGSITQIKEGYILDIVKTETNESISLIANDGVAEVEGEIYNSLELALAECGTEEKTIKLLKSIIISESNLLVIEENQNITLDLNGKTIKCASKVVPITNNGRLKLIDTSETPGVIEGTASTYIKNSGYLEFNHITLSALDLKNNSFVISSTEGSEIVINSGTITVEVNDNFTSHAIYAVSGTKVTMNGGIINLNGYTDSSPYGGTSYSKLYGIYINNADMTKLSEVTINEGAVITQSTSGRGYPIMVTGKGNIEINEATIKGYNGVQLIEGNLNVNSGIIEVVGDGYGLLISRNSIANIYDGVSITGNGIAIQNSNGIVNMYGGDISVTNDGIALSNGRFNMYGGTINADGNGVYGSGTSNINIEDGTINSISENGIYISNGKVTLGKKEYPVSTSNPNIAGNLYGVTITGTAETNEFNFYDGVIRGETKAYTGMVKDVPELYSVSLSDDEKEAILDLIVTFDQVALVNGIYYDSLQGAIDAACISGAIVCLDKDAISENKVIIPENSNITIDLKAHSIIGGGECETILNNGNLTIINSEEDGQQTAVVTQVLSLINIAIINNGNLYIGSDDGTMYENSPQINGKTIGVQNNGIAYLYDGKISGDIVFSGNEINVLTGYQYVIAENNLSLIVEMSQVIVENQNSVVESSNTINENVTLEAEITKVETEVINKNENDLTINEVFEEKEIITEELEEKVELVEVDIKLDEEEKLSEIEFNIEYTSELIEEKNSEQIKEDIVEENLTEIEFELKDVQEENNVEAENLEIQNMFLQNELTEN